MKVAILAGGLGTRLSEETSSRPKPMVEVGGRPLLWHLMQHYAVHGFDDFVIALGYRAEVVKQYFLNFHALNHDLTIDLCTGGTAVHQRRELRGRVTLVDTGETTQTGGRVRRLQPWLGDETFMLTYGDGLSNVDLRALLEFHRSHGRLATVTAVRPPSRFGGLRLEGEFVVEFDEKPQTGEGWINGGFFVLEPGVFELIPGDATPLEREPIERLAAMGQLAAFRHEGFWQPMDTLRDRQLLEERWASGHAEWLEEATCRIPGLVA